MSERHSNILQKNFLDFWKYFITEIDLLNIYI